MDKGGAVPANLEQNRKPQQADKEDSGDTSGNVDRPRNQSGVSVLPYEHGGLLGYADMLRRFSDDEQVRQWHAKAAKAQENKEKKPCLALSNCSVIETR